MLELEECVSSTDEAIPPDLEVMAPGPVLAALLSSIDVTRVSGYDRVVMLRAHQRMISHYTAELYGDMAAVVDALEEDGDDGPYWSAADAAAAEIRSALHLTRRAADVELAFALDLRQRLPRLAHMLESGQIDARRARVIERNTVHLDDATARSVLDRIADAAPGLTTGQLAVRIRRSCIEADPDEAARRYETSVKERRVIMEPTDAGTANLFGLDLPPNRVAAVTRRINAMARRLRGGGETRSMDQLRADVYLDLLCGRGGTTRGSGVVDIRVDLDTLAALAEHPGELAGYGPVIADIARQTAEDQPDGEWRYTITNPKTGQPIRTGTTRRRPSTAERGAVESRNPTCVFPGCRMPATECDLNHRIRWADGGPTDVDHLDPLCRHGHIIHHDGHWSYTRHPNGDYQWISKLGHTYVTPHQPP